MEYRRFDWEWAGKALLTGTALVLLLLGGFLLDREEDREEGWANGYTTGYSIGYMDYLNGQKRTDMEIAGKIVPYETGSGKWKYFIMGVSEGYSDAQTGEGLWHINES